MCKWLPAGEQKGFGHKHIVDTVLTWKEQILKCIKHVFGDNVTDGFVAQKAVCANMLYLLGFYFSIWFPGQGFISSQLDLAWSWWEVLSCCSKQPTSECWQLTPLWQSPILPFWHHLLNHHHNHHNRHQNAWYQLTFFDNLPFCSYGKGWLQEALLYGFQYAVENTSNIWPLLSKGQLQMTFLHNWNRIPCLW